jgi:TRAP-type uncharacterized transport system substrate-binding protein
MNRGSVNRVHGAFAEETRKLGSRQHLWAVDPDVTIPCHPAVVQYYKERAVWSAALDDAQRELLNLNP